MEYEDFVYWLIGIMDRTEGGLNEYECRMIKEKLSAIQKRGVVKPLTPYWPLNEATPYCLKPGNDFQSQGSC